MRNELLRLIVVGSAWLTFGCNDEGDMAANNSTTAPVPPASAAMLELTPSQPPPPTALPPPGATVPAVPAGTTTGPETLASDGSLASCIMANRSAYFVDKDGRFEPTTAQEVLERAILAYREMRIDNSDDDAPEWPPFTDLSLLVKYKILKTLPPAPNGQTFAYDVNTRKVTLK